MQSFWEFTLVTPTKYKKHRYFDIRNLDNQNKSPKLSTHCHCAVGFIFAVEKQTHIHTYTTKSVWRRVGQCERENARNKKSIFSMFSIEFFRALVIRENANKRTNELQTKQFSRTNECSLFGKFYAAKHLQQHTDVRSAHLSQPTPPPPHSTRRSHSYCTRR